MLFCDQILNMIQNSLILHLIRHRCLLNLRVAPDRDVMHDFESTLVDGCFHDSRMGRLIIHGRMKIGVPPYRPSR